MFYSRFLLNQFILLSIIVFISSCDKEIVDPLNTTEQVSIEPEDILSTYIYHEYNADSTASQIFAQITLDVNSPIDLIDSVYIVSDPPIIDHVRLYSDEELFYDNGVYEAVVDLVPAIQTDLYNFTFFLSYDNGLIHEIDEVLDIQFYPDTPPTIDIVCMPEIYTINEIETDTFFVYISVDDLNGIHDIKSASLELKKLPGYQIGEIGLDGECTWKDTVDQEYQDFEENDLYHLLDYSLNNDCELLEGEISNNFVHGIGLEIDSYYNCGPHGPISFRYIVEDNAGYKAYSTHDLLICHPGICD